MQKVSNPVLLYSWNSVRSGRDNLFFRKKLKNCWNRSPILSITTYFTRTYYVADTANCSIPYNEHSSSTCLEHSSLLRYLCERPWKQLTRTCSRCFRLDHKRPTEIYQLLEFSVNGGHSTCQNFGIFSFWATTSSYGEFARLRDVSSFIPAHVSHMIHHIELSRTLPSIT